MKIEAHDFLTINDFNEWLNKLKNVRGFASTARSLLSGKKELTVSFSTQEKQERYNGKSVDEVKDFLYTTLNVNAETKKFLDKISTKDEFDSKLEELASFIAKTNDGYSFDDALGVLRKQSDKMAFTEDILGEYVPNERRIVLYVRAIEKGANSRAEAKKFYEEVFADVVLSI